MSNNKKKGKLLFHALDQVLGVSIKKDNIVYNFTQVPQKDTKENATRFQVPVLNSGDLATYSSYQRTGGHKYAFVVRLW